MSWHQLATCWQQQVHLLVEATCNQGSFRYPLQLGIMELLQGQHQLGKQLMMLKHLSRMKSNRSCWAIDAQRSGGKLPAEGDG
jgi:hypothetical protein